MKTIYFIRHAKAGWSQPDTRDFERALSKKGKKDLNTIGSYLAIREIKPELILSSCALRAQETSDILAKKINFNGTKYYLEELYNSSLEAMIEIIMIQDADINSIFIVGHNPQLHELVNSLIDEHINKFPTLGVVAINFDISEWSEIKDAKGVLDFFIFPKQFKYYMPRQIRGMLSSHSE